MRTEDKLVIIGIDSLDPRVLIQYRDRLPTFADLIMRSPTFTTTSVFPVDTIPAWGSIYTGLHPGNHGLLYIFDVFDPHLSDLRKLEVNRIRGRTFWDYVGQEGQSCAVLFPMLMYPAWNVNGVMISKSPFERRLDMLRTERDITVCPETFLDECSIPHTLEDLWGGFPGNDALLEWAELGKNALEIEKRIGIDVLKKGDWNLYFIYFSLLDIIQHRLWRFFDPGDPTYPGVTSLQKIILDYYILFDGIVAEYMRKMPDAGLMVLSDHGHRCRPHITVNLNEYLRKKGYLVARETKGRLMGIVRKAVLEVIHRFHLEHVMIRIVSSNPKLTSLGKSVYSSSDVVNKEESTAWLSRFAGIKSYPFGGIEINRHQISDTEYVTIVDEIIRVLREMKTPDHHPLMKWAVKRQDLYAGVFTQEIYPDIVFELENTFGIGWEVFSGDFGRSYDHNVASGGHDKTAVLLMDNISKQVFKKEISIIDIAPSILDHFGLPWKSYGLDGDSIFED